LQNYFGKLADSLTKKRVRKPEKTKEKPKTKPEKIISELEMKPRLKY
jgi:hypothetical protein